MDKNAFCINSFKKKLLPVNFFTSCKLLLLACVILFVSCQNDEMDGGIHRSMNFIVNGNAVESLILNPEDTTVDLIVKSSKNWVLEMDSEWISADKICGESGETNIHITLQINSGVNTRRSIFKFITSNNEIQNFALVQTGEIDPGSKHRYHFYATFGTIPTLYSGLHMLSHGEPSFFGYERSGTFEPSFFPSYVSHIPSSDVPEDLLLMGEVMKKEILKINNNDPAARFEFYVDDLRCRLGYDWFIAQGIDSSRVNVNLWSDGTATYNNFYNFFGSNSNAESNWNRVVSEVEALNWNTGVQTRGVPAEFNSAEWPYYMSTLPNYKFLLHDKGLLETESSFIQNKVAVMNAVSVSPEQMLKALSPVNQERFFNMCNFDKTHYSEMFDVSSKPNLVIIGTNGNAEQQNYVKKVYDQYGATYDIFYKPHPADATCSEYETLFPGLKLLPGRMPFEVFVWSLMDKIDILGGFASTVYLTVPTEKVRFLLGVKNATELIKPLDKMFQNSSVEYIY